MGERLAYADVKLEMLVFRYYLYFVKCHITFVNGRRDLVARLEDLEDRGIIDFIAHYHRVHPALNLLAVNRHAVGASINHLHLPTERVGLLGGRRLSACFTALEIARRRHKKCELLV